MTATPEQIATLERFAAEQGAGWEVLERAGLHFANLTAKVTDEYVWFLQLEPLVPEDSPYAINGKHPAWKAGCQKGVDADESQSTSGPLGVCTAWLENRMKEWQRERRVADHLKEFATGRPKWHFYDQPQGRHYAGRRFEYGGSGEKFLLSVLPHAPSRRYSCFRAQINMSFAAGPEHVFVGDTIDQVTEWALQWEKLLSLPLQLAECGYEEAVERVGRLSGSDVAALTYLLDISGSVPVSRQRLVEKFCPAATSRRGA